MTTFRFQSRAKSVTRTACGLLAALALVAGCSTARAAEQAPSASASSSASPTPTVPATRSPLPVIGTPMPTKTHGLTVTVNGVRRGANGLLTVVWTVKNTGNDTVDISEPFLSDNDPYFYHDDEVSAMTITDHQAKLKYYPLIDDAAECVCSIFNQTEPELDPGHSRILYDIYKPQGMPSSIEIDIPGFAPLKNVQVPNS